MKHMTKLLTLTTAMALSGVASAASVSGSTNFKVTVPEILVLYHWDEAHLTLQSATTTAANDSDSHEISDATVRTGTANLSTASPYSITGDVATTDSYSTLGGNVSVVLKNAWAVRSISSGNVSLALTEQSGSYTLKNVADSTATIAITDAKLKHGTDASNATLSLAPGWAPKMGNIEFKMNLSGVTKSGTYTSNGAASPTDETDDTFLLTLTGN